MVGQRWRIYAFLMTLSTINYVDRVALSVAAKPLSEQFGIGTVGMGYLFSSFIWGYFACLILWGIAIDHWGTRAANAVGMALFSIATIATGFTWNFVSVLAARLVMGAGEASTFPAGGKMIREWIPASERGLAAAALNGGSYAGPAVGALIVSAIVTVTGWRGGFIAVGAMGFVWLAFWLVVYRLPEHARFLGAAERDLILRERGGGAQTDVEAGEVGGVGTLMRNPAMWGLLLTQGCASYSQFLFLTWLPSYIEAERHLTIMKTGLFTALPYGIAVVLGLVIGRVSDRMLDKDAVQKGKRRNMIAMALLVAAVVLLLPIVDSIWLMVAIVSLSLTGISTAVSLNIALVSDLLEAPSQAGKATGLLITGGALFAIIAPIATGYLVAFTGNFSAAFILAGAILFIGIVSCLALTRGRIRCEKHPEMTEMPVSRLRA